MSLKSQDQNYQEMSIPAYAQASKSVEQSNRSRRRSIAELRRNQDISLAYARKSQNSRVTGSTTPDALYIPNNSD